MERQHFLDGLRGWGAVVVLLYHLFCAGFPTSDFSRDYLKFFLPFNATNAVFVFFIVSGFALSMPFFASGDRRVLLRMAVGRYPRLVIPIFPVCLLVHLASVSGILAPAAERYPPFGGVVSTVPTWFHLFRFSLFDVFFNFSYAASYAGPLWTMSIELIGSFVVLALSWLIPARMRLPSLALMSMILVLAGSYYSLFVIGSLMADLWSRGHLRVLPTKVAAILLIFSCAAPFVFPWTVNVGIILGAVAFVTAIASTPQLRSLVSSRLSLELGRISFPLYLVHESVMMIVGSPLMLRYGSSHGFSVQMLVLLIAFAAAYALSPVNTLAIDVSRRVARTLSLQVWPDPDQRGLKKA